MPDAETVEPTRHTVEMDQSTPFLITQDKLFSFRSAPIAFARWTITTWGIDFLGLPADPRTVHAQIHFPPNVDISVSDNFSVLVAMSNRHQIITSTWRVDKGDPPASQYQFDFLITLF